MSIQINQFESGIKTNAQLQKPSGVAVGNGTGIKDIPVVGEFSC
jgi:hypothetical protein